MSTFWTKAVVAQSSARLLLEQGDTSGAVNRAYFAMFQAARSTLEQISPDLALAKRHATIVARFAQLVVRSRGLDPSIGRSFNLAMDQRLVADYERQPIGAAVGRAVVADMHAFLRQVAPLNPSSSA